MFARFSIGYENHENALVIPADALLDDADDQAVFVVSNGQVQRRVVETGITTDGNVEIIGGLLDSDVVVVVGQSALRDGSKVLASSSNDARYSG